MYKKKKIRCIFAVWGLKYKVGNLKEFRLNKFIKSGETHRQTRLVYLPTFIILFKFIITIQWYI